MTPPEQIIALADRYCAANGLSRARVSTLVLGGGARLDAIAAGADVRTRTFSRAVKWFSDNWPAGAVWPDDIQRPAPLPDNSASSAPAEVPASANAEDRASLGVSSQTLAGAPQGASALSGEAEE